ncbi:MAG: hypothetical protein ACRD2Y_10295 [Terriglobales bacterium]
MMAPRLVLKRSTGWFAAGREVAAALEILSDPAFKLYLHICLNADRQAGTLTLESAERKQPLPNSNESIGGALEELRQRGVCRIQDHLCQTVIEVCDRFWPYQKPPRSATPGEELPGFVEQVRAMFLTPACVRSSFTVADEKLAASFYQQGVTLADLQLQRAIWLGCARKYVAMLNRQTSGAITSLRYFASIVEEVAQTPAGQSYWDHLQHRTDELEKRWLKARQPARRKEMMETK